VTQRPPSEGADDGPLSFDAIVLGCGISGLVAASVLTEQPNLRVLAIDEYPHIGGNHIDRTIGNFTFDVGSFLFQDDSPLLAYLPELLPRYVVVQPSWARLNPQGVVTRYPISIRDDLITAGPAEWLRMLGSVAVARLFRRDLRNARDFAQYWIGARVLRRTGLEGYLERFYGVPADRIDIRFAESRMLWIKEHGSILPLLRLLGRRLRARPQPPPNQQLARPREGFGHLYSKSKERLEERGVTFQLGAGLRSLTKTDTRFALRTDAGTFVTDRVVSTVPIDRALELCGIPDEEKLQSVTLISLFFSFRGERNFKEAILYNFSDRGAWKRLTVYSDFYGRAEGREFFTVEVNADHVDGSASRAEQDFCQHVRENGLFDGDLRLEGTYRLANAYPIYTDGADERAARAIEKLRVLGVQSFGRQGAFRYQPTARVSALEAAGALSNH
jgi:protoporphyrinogen oxidase